MRTRGRYSDGAFGWEAQFEAGQDSLRLDEGFVNAPAMVGNDEQYAATMALLANRLGVPARVAVGTVLDKNGVIKGKHLDAWVEIRVADGSWRVLETSEFMGHRAPKRDDVKLTPVKLPPERDNQARPEEQQRPEDLRRARARRPTQAEKDVPLPRWPLFLLHPRVGRADPGRQGRTPPAPAFASLASAAYLGGWDELLDTARDLGVAVPPRSTRPAQARALGVPDQRSPATPMSRCSRRPSRRRPRRSGTRSTRSADASRPGRRPGGSRSRRSTRRRSSVVADRRLSRRRSGTKACLSH